MNPYRRGETDFGAALRIDLGGEVVDRAALPRRDLAERLPERVLKRNACPVPPKRQRPLDGPATHSSRLCSSRCFSARARASSSAARSDFVRPCFAALPSATRRL